MFFITGEGKRQKKGEETKKRKEIKEKEILEDRESIKGRKGGKKDTLEGGPCVIKISTSFGIKSHFSFNCSSLPENAHPVWLCRGLPYILTPSKTTGESYVELEKLK